MATGTKRPKGRGGRKSQYGGQRKLPAREGWPDEVVVGKPVVENGDERLPLRVALVHRRPGAASLLHLRHRWSTPATAPHLTPTATARSLLLRERAGVSILDACGVPALRAERGAEDPMFGAERGLCGLGRVLLGPVVTEAKRIFCGLL